MGVFETGAVFKIQPGLGYAQRMEMERVQKDERLLYGFYRKGK